MRPEKVALLYVSDFSRQDVEAGLKLDLTHLGRAGATVTDAESGAPIAHEGTTCRLKVPAHDFRVLRITSGH